MNIKNLACLAAAFAASTVFADSITISLGITKVSSPYKNTIVAVPYGGFEQGQDMTVSNVVKTSDLQAGDYCYAMSGSDNLYNAWSLATGTGGVLYWQPTTQITMTNGVAVTTTSPTPDSVQLAPGSAIWIVRSNRADAYIYENFPFYLWGQYTNVVASTVKSSTAGTWNLVANCGQSAMKISDMIASMESGKGENYWNKMDQIVIMNNAGAKVGAAYTGKKWLYSGTDGGITITGNTTLAPGMGCWVFKQGADKDTTIQWPTAE